MIRGNKGCGTDTTLRVI